MSNTSKSSKKATPVNGASATTDFVETFAPVYLNSVERLAELQKQSLDVAAEQTADWMNAWKNVFSSFAVPTPSFFFDVVGQAVQTCVETQKSAIDLAVEQTQSLTEIGKTRADAYSKITESATAAFQSTVTRSVEAQKKVLEFASAQNKNICEATKKTIGNGPATTFVDAYERGAETIIQTQKQILDATTKPFAARA